MTTTTRTFRCRPEAVTAARMFVRERLHGRPLELIEAAELMTSEVATNCVLHAHTDFELAIDAEDEIRIEVSDQGPGRPKLLSPGARQLTGRGLRIVDAMADAWGVDPATQGKSVWFTLGASQPPGSRRAHG